MLLLTEARKALGNGCSVFNLNKAVRNYLATTGLHTEAIIINNCKQVE